MIEKELLEDLDRGDHGPLGGDVGYRRRDGDGQLLRRLRAELRTPVATVSRKVSELETRLKAELFQRSSRRMMLTDAGRSYIEACKRIIEQVDDAERRSVRRIQGAQGRPGGDRAVGPRTHALLPIAVEFLSAYPDIALRLVLTDRVVNTVDENIDVAIRIGTLPDSSMIATSIGSIRFVVCGSPPISRSVEFQRSSAIFADHDCITFEDIATPADLEIREGAAHCRADPVAADREYVRGRHRGRHRRARAGPRHVLQNGSGERAGKLTVVLGRLRAGTAAGAYRLRAAETGAPQAPCFSQLGHAAPQSTVSSETEKVRARIVD